MIRKFLKKVKKLSKKTVKIFSNDPEEINTSEMINKWIESVKNSKKIQINLRYALTQLMADRRNLKLEKIF